MKRYIPVIFILTILCMGSEINTLSPLAQDIQILQPRVGDARAERLATIFQDAGEINNIDPKLLIAFTHRESSFHPAYEARLRFGSRNEIGLMQIHGIALQFRPADCSQDLPGARCQIMTGANFLAYVRNTCGGSPYRWIAAYGMSTCPSEDRAPSVRGVINIQRYYAAIGGNILHTTQ